MNAPTLKSAATAKIASFSPRTACVHTAEKTEAITIGVKVRSEKSRSKISRTKKMPAIGALNTEAIPAAAPQPSSVAVFWGLIRRSWPTFDPTADPIWMIGPSAPADPPEPIVQMADTHLAMATRNLIRDLLR